MRITAPMEYRLKMLMKETGLDEASAMKLIEKNDRRKASYIKCCYREDWDNPALYHLIVNIEEVGVDSAPQFIADAALNFTANQ